jgi:hypothetical protein
MLQGALNKESSNLLGNLKEILWKYRRSQDIKLPKIFSERLQVCLLVFAMCYLDCPVGGSASSMATDITSLDQGRACVILQLNVKTSTSSRASLHVIRAFHTVTIFNQICEESFGLTITDYYTRRQILQKSVFINQSKGTCAYWGTEPRPASNNHYFSFLYLLQVAVIAAKMCRYEVVEADLCFGLYCSLNPCR